MVAEARPYVLLSCAMSLDGYIDDSSPERLVLSNQEDLDRVDEVRASVDAILVGAGTVRADNPQLLVRSPERRQLRALEGKPADPVKVVVTNSGKLDPAARLFTTGDAAKLVYCPSHVVQDLARQLGQVATVVGLDDPVQLKAVLHDLAGRGMQRLLVEGGSHVHTELLSRSLADELQLVVAPFFVGDATAPRFVLPARFAHGPTNPLHLAEARPIGDAVLLRYLR